MRIQSKNFTIHSDSIDNINEKLLETLEESLYDYLKFFKLKSTFKIDIILYKTKDIYLESMYQLGEEVSQKSISNFDAIEKTIRCVYDEEKIETRLKREIIHILFYYVYSDKYERKLWLDEGLAQYLAKPKMSEEEFKNWYLSKIVSKDKVIPDMKDLTNHGNRFDEFLDTKNNTYNGYDLSFAMTRYLFDVYGKSHVSNFIQDKKQIETIENTILEEMTKYYDRLFKIKDIKKYPSEIKTVEQLINYVNVNLKYGWYDFNDNLHTNGDKKTYQTMSFEEILNRQVGTSFERAIFASNILTNLKIKNKIVVDINKMIAYPVVKQLDWKQLNWRIGLTSYKEKDSLIEIDEIPVGLSFEELREYVESFKKDISKK